MWSPFMEFPRELGFPQRAVIVYNMDDFISKINRANGKMTIFASLYSFSKLQDNGKPDYSSTKISHIYLDLDNSECLQNTRKLHQYLQSENLAHCINFSGAGFHIFVQSEGSLLQIKKAAIFNAVVDIAYKGTA